MGHSALKIIIVAVGAGALVGYIRALSPQNSFGTNVLLEQTPNRYSFQMHVERYALGGECSFSWQCGEGLVCHEHVCSRCASNFECEDYNLLYQCLNTSSGQSECRHKGLWSPLEESDILMIFITIGTIMLSAPAGVGGGCILVPMFLMVGHFSSHYSSALSAATIFGGAVSNNFFNLQKRHPKKDRPLIDFNTCMMMVPMLLLGTIIGVFFNETAPKWMISVLLVVALVYTTWRTTLKAFETYKKETEAEVGTEKSRLLPAQGSTHPHPPAIPGDDPKKLRVISQDVNIKIEPVADDAGEKSSRATLEEIIRAESEVNMSSLACLLLSWVVIALCSTLKGGGGSPGVVPCGSPWYWVLVFLPMPLILSQVWVVGSRLTTEHDLKVSSGYDFADGDLQWTRTNALVYPLSCVTAGVCAGALGIAAGMVLGPLLLELGMLPIVATASSGFMVLFVSSSAALQFLIMGQLPADYAVAFALLGAAAGAVGNVGVGHLLRRYRKTWFVVAILAAVFALSAAFMAAASYSSAATAAAHGQGWAGHPLCPAVATALRQHTAG